MLVADGQERVDRVEGAASVAIGRWIGAWIAKHTPGKRWWVAVCTITISIRCFFEVAHMLAGLGYI